MEVKRVGVWGAGRLDSLVKCPGVWPLRFRVYCVGAKKRTDSFPVRTFYLGELRISLPLAPSLRFAVSPLQDILGGVEE